jgi:hypothetical protein
MLLGDLAAVVGALDGVLDVLYALVGLIHQDHVTGHVPSSLPPEDWAGLDASHLDHHASG